MKRIAILSLTLACVFVLSVFAVGAAETSYGLIPNTENWTVEKYGQTCEIDVKYNDDGSVVFTGTAAWPSVTTYYETPITVDVATTSLVFDFSYSVGNSNISFFFQDDEGNNYGYTMNNTAINATAWDLGSGDIAAGEYKMSLKLSDLVASTKLVTGEAFPADAICDGKLTFTGIQVFAVGGASITVKEMKLVTTTADDPDEETSSDEGTTSEEGTSSEEAVSSEAAASSEESKTPATGDSSVIVFAVLAVVALAGTAVAVKSRK